MTNKSEYSDVYVGSYYRAYDGPDSVDIAFSIKSSFSKAASTLHNYIGYRCSIMLNDNEYRGTPYLAKISRGKYVLSISFTKPDDDNGALLLSLSAMANIDNVSMSIKTTDEPLEEKIDIQFWEKIKKSLQGIAAYAGVAREWEDYKGYVKVEYGIKYIVSPSMSAANGEHFYECVKEYANKNGIKIEESPILRDVENYINKCRRQHKCCVCAEKEFDATVYPLCQVHYDEFIDLGKASFERKYKL